MTWFRVDDTLNDHRRTERLLVACKGDGVLLYLARGVWTSMGVDCAARETDGVFTRARAADVLAKLPVKQRERVFLVLLESGYWEDRGDEIAFHDWSQYQPTKAQLDERRAKNAERQNRHRNGVTNTVTNGGSNSVTNAVISRAQSGAPRTSHAPSPRTSMDGSREKTSPAPSESAPLRESNAVSHTVSNASPGPALPGPIPPNPPQAGGAHFRSTEIRDPLTADELERRKQAARDAVAKLTTEDRHG